MAKQAAKKPVAKSPEDRFSQGRQRIVEPALMSKDKRLAHNKEVVKARAKQAEKDKKIAEILNS